MFANDLLNDLESLGGNYFRVPVTTLEQKRIADGFDNNDLAAVSLQGGSDRTPSSASGQLLEHRAASIHRLGALASNCIQRV